MGKPTYSIRTARSEGELERIFRFRYDIYVKELGRPQFDADHSGNRVRDRLDDWATNFYVVDDSEDVIGVVRGNAWRDGSDVDYDSMYEPQNVGSDHPLRTCMVTKLMIAPHMRHGPLAHDLFMWLHDYATEQDLRWIFLDCNAWLVPFFKGFGFTTYRSHCIHKEYGEVIPMKVDLWDREQLASVGSPFLRCAPASPSRSLISSKSSPTACNAASVSAPPTAI